MEPLQPMATVAVRWHLLRGSHPVSRAWRAWERWRRAPSPGPVSPVSALLSPGDVRGHPRSAVPPTPRGWTPSGPESRELDTLPASPGSRRPLHHRSRSGRTPAAAASSRASPASQSPAPCMPGSQPAEERCELWPAARRLRSAWDKGVSDGATPSTHVAEGFRHFQKACPEGELREGVPPMLEFQGETVTETGPGTRRQPLGGITGPFGPAQCWESVPSPAREVEESPPPRSQACHRELTLAVG